MVTFFVKICPLNNNKVKVMFGIGFPEMILILALALIVVGPDKLPDLARSIAKTIMDLKKTAEGLKDTLHIDDNPLSEIKPQLEDAAKNFKDTILDAETHTWEDPSLPLPPNTETFERPSTDPLQTNQTVSEETNDSQTKPDSNVTPEPSTNTQDNNSADTEKHV
jgi:sec-independent protein translocase protein TatB